MILIVLLLTLNIFNPFSVESKLSQPNILKGRIQLKSILLKDFVSYMINFPSKVSCLIYLSSQVIINMGKNTFYF